jgi:hypothetical protein
VIQKSATGHSSTVRNFYQRFLDAERISKQLDGAWKDVSLAYDELNVCFLPSSVSRRTDDAVQTATALVTEAKVVGLHTRIENLHDRVELVHVSEIASLSWARVLS